MKIRFIFLPLLFLYIHTAFSQNAGGMANGICMSCTNSPAAPAAPKKGGGQAVMDGNEAFNTSYTVTACGLNYVSANFNLHQRAFSFGTGAAQPAPFVVSGIPLCGKILKAFLYTACESNGFVNINASITNPLGANSIFPMTQIGVGASICWGYNNFYSYRADITSIISGNGTYFLSGLPVAPSANDVDGASLFIMYTDETQNYTGSMVIADGVFTSNGTSALPGNVIQSSYTGFNVCGATSLTENFMILADMQRSADMNIGLNSAVSNYTLPAASQNPWMLISQSGVAATAGQTTAQFYADNLGGDCYGVVMTGMYYRTNCLTCPTQMTVNAMTPLCSPTGSAIALVAGGTAPYSYTWTGSAANTATVAGLAPGVHTLTVSDLNSCKTRTTTLNVTRPSTITVANSSVCIGYSTPLTAVGSTSTYTWSPGASLNTTNAQSVSATPLVTTVYTVVSTNSLGCNTTNTAQVIVSPTQTITIANPTACVGGNLTFTASSTYTGATYNWAGPLGYSSSGVASPTITGATAANAGLYILTVTSLPGCTTSAVSNAVVNPLPTPTITSNSPICFNQTLNLQASGATTYAWAGPNGFSSTQTNTSIPGATTLASGIYTLTGFYPTTCSASVTRSLTVKPLPVPVVGYNNPLCIGTTLSLTVSGATSYTWNGPNGFNSTVQNPTIANVTALAAGNYTVLASLLSCTNTGGTLVVVNPLPVPTATSNSPVCAANKILLSAGGAATYSWTGPSAFSSSLQNPTITPAAMIHSGTYSVTVTDLLGCKASTTTIVTIIPNPGVTITGTNVCLNAAGSLTATGGTGYFWQGPNSFTSNVAIPTVTLVNATTSGLYSVTVTGANTCTSVATVSLGTIPLPTVVPTSTATCMGQTATLTASGAVSYTWSGPNGFAAVGANPMVVSSNLTAGVYTIVGTAPNTCTNAATTTLVALPLPTVVASNNSPVCETHSLQLSSGGAVTYSWIGPNTFTSAIQNPSIFPTPMANAGTYTVTGTDALGCRLTVMTTVTVMANPVIAVTGTNVCLNEPATLTVTGGGTYSWSGPNGFTSTSATPTIGPMTATNSGVYNVTVTAANSCTTGGGASLGTIPLPTVVPTSTAACAGYIATLTASGAASYVWTGPNNFNGVGPSVSMPANNLSTGTYTIVGTAPNTCTNIAFTSLSTIPLPTVVASSATVCLREPAVITTTGTSVDTYTWSGPGGFTANTANANITSANSVPVSVYTVVVQALNTCTSSATASLSTLPLPTVTATGTLICLNEPYTMVANGAVTYSWTGPNNFTLPNSPIAFIPSVNNLTAGNYTIQATAVNGCTNINTAPVTLATMPLPTITAVGSTVCFGKPTVLQASGGISGGYTWTGPNNYSSNTQNAFIPVTDNVSAGVYNVVGTAPNTCTNSTTAILGFNPLPQPTYSAPQRVCFKSSMNLTGFGAKTYTWSGPFNYYSANQKVTIPIYNMQQAGTYTLNVLDSLGCANYTTVLIKIDPQPNGKLLSDNKNNYCVPFCSKFKLQSTGVSPIVSSSWLVNNKIFQGDTFSYCVSNVHANFVIGTFTDAVGCLNTVTFAINAYPTPVADYNYTPEKPTETLDEVVFTNTSVGDKQVDWDWYFVNNKGYVGTGQNVSHSFYDAGSYEVAMVVTNTWGCADTVVKTIVIDSDVKIYVPNAFTPNGDGLNDIFQPKGRGIQKYNLTIFDRWSNIVFESNEFTKGWDGSMRGTSCTDDIYVWKINAVDDNGKVRELNGFVTLTR